MARTRVNGVEKGRPALPKRNFPGDETGERVEEQPKTRKVIKINHVHHVVEWIPETEAVSGEPAEGNINIPVKLKEITRLETPEECEKRKAAYAEAKRITLESSVCWHKYVSGGLNYLAPRLRLKQTRQLMPDVSLAPFLGLRLKPKALIAWLVAGL